MLTTIGSGLGSVGYALLATYDTQACLSKCDQTSGCVAANIYFERAPTSRIDPAIGCDDLDPPSTTLIKCAFWGHAINAQVATDYGEAQYNSKVAIRGSNGYVKDSAILESMAATETVSALSSTSAATSTSVPSEVVTVSSIRMPSPSSTTTQASSTVHESDSPRRLGLSLMAMISTALACITLLALL